MESIITRNGLSYVSMYFVMQTSYFNSFCGYHGDMQSNLSLMKALLCLHVCSMGSILSADCLPWVQAVIPLHANSKACMHSVIRSGPCCAWQAGSATVQRWRLCLCDYCGENIKGITKTDEAWPYMYWQSWFWCGGATCSPPRWLWSRLVLLCPVPSQEFELRTELDSRISQILFCQMCTFLFFFFFRHSVRLQQQRSGSELHCSVASDWLQCALFPFRVSVFLFSTCIISRRCTNSLDWCWMKICFHVLDEVKLLHLLLIGCGCIAESGC